MTGVIILAGIMVALQSDMNTSRMLGPQLDIIDQIILIIFSVEVVFKFFAEEFEPWNFFTSRWNIFDFVVVAGSLVSAIPAVGGPTTVLTMMRLLRLLRVLKLVKSLPQLQVGEGRVTVGVGVRVRERV